VEAESEGFVLGVGDAKDRLLRPLPGGAGKDVEELDGGHVERDEAVELVDAADRVDHPLPGEHLIGEEVAEAAGEARLDACHARWYRGPASNRRPPDPQSGALTN